MKLLIFIGMFIVQFDWLIAQESEDNLRQQNKSNDNIILTATSSVSIACPFDCDGDVVFETATGTYFDPVCQCWYDYKYLQRVINCKVDCPDEAQFYLYEISKRATDNENCDSDPPCDVYSIKDRIYSSIIDDMLRTNEFANNMDNGFCFLSARVHSASCWAVSIVPGPTGPVEIMHPCETEVCCKGRFKICRNLQGQIEITQLSTNNPSEIDCDMPPPTFVPFEPNCFAMCFESSAQVIEENNNSKLTFSKISDFEIYSQELNGISSIVIFSYDGRVLVSGNKPSDFKGLRNNTELINSNKQFYFSITKSSGEKLNGTIGVK